MSSTFNYMTFLVLYFVSINVIWGVIALDEDSVFFSNTDVKITGGASYSNVDQFGSVENGTEVNEISVWKVGGYLDRFFSFFTFRVDLGLGNYNWIVTAIFVYMPFMMLLLGLYYSVRSGN